ncbi:low affinity iron permease family protein [Pseudomonas putida]|uniref:low affinity iron permease family protein n=1 Tax=Pseudomonas TaxID=286 RepID=UPI0010597847|nr:MULTISPECIES: low affinity iron permease family protein [Pseudomonas]MBF8745309.1 low affinity iron permease family protein [Pseudomonas monteilii]MCT8163441.1 low affinity iron permease family protein [Pseudomonas sp. HD6422]MCT8182219.1 low affinity iron permease family protein [Pseudomonas sp. HD6421]TDJ79228.1 low affinity iron permease family protein [Pseudomonas putida]
MRFERFAQWLANWAGRPLTFGVALALIVIWALSGALFDYNDTWQLVINTSTTIITFLMVFLIQNTQNRDNDVLHIKIDELLRTTKRAHKALLDLEDMDPAQLHALRQQYQRLGEDQEHKQRSSDQPTQDAE